jgi:hypothetical protein
MATLLEECTIEEQRSVLRSYVGKRTRIRRFLFTVGSVCRVKRFTTGVEKRGKRFAVDEEVETEERKLLRQQTKDFYAAGFDALLKRATSILMLVEDM